MSEMRISAERAATRPKYDLLSSAVLERCRKFFENEENERAYQEWEKQRSGRNETVKG